MPNKSHTLLMFLTIFGIAAADVLFLDTPSAQSKPPLLPKINYAVAGVISSIDAKSKPFDCSKLKVVLMERNPFFNPKTRVQENVKSVAISEGFATKKGVTCRYSLALSNKYLSNKNAEFQVSARDVNYSVDSGGYSGESKFTRRDSSNTEKQPTLGNQAEAYTTTINFQVGFIKGLN